MQIRTQRGGTLLNFHRRFQNPVGDSNSKNYRAPAPRALGRFPPTPFGRPRPGAGNYPSRHAARGAPLHVPGAGGAGAGCCGAGGAVSARCLLRAAEREERRGRSPRPSAELLPLGRPPGPLSARPGSSGLVVGL